MMKTIRWSCFTGLLAVLLFVSSCAQPDPPPTPVATAAPTLAATATTAPTATPTPTPTPVPTATPTPTPAPAARQLTSGGCCTQPFWAPDSRHVLVIDQPAADAPLGIWQVDTAAVAPTPTLFSERIAFYTDDLAYLIEAAGERTTVERLDDGARWTVPAAGEPVSLSPGRTRIAWTVSNEAVPIERRMTQIWAANLDGSDARQVATLPRGAVRGWLDDERLLVSGRASLESLEQVVSVLDIGSGKLAEVTRAERMRGERLSPDGQWLVYYVTFQDDPAQNGLWVVRTDGRERRRLDPALFGGYQWRDGHRLLIVPFKPDAAAHEVWEYDAETATARRLTDPAVTPFKIANGDWQVSPDGKRIVFVEAADRNVWVLALAE